MICQHLYAIYSSTHRVLLPPPPSESVQLNVDQVEILNSKILTLILKLFFPS